MNRIAKHWAKFLLLSREQKAVLFGSMVFLPLAALSIRVFGLSEICRRLSVVQSSSTNAKQQDIHNASLICRVVDIAATRGFYKANCLTRALVLKWWLNRERIASDLVFGTNISRSGDVEFKAHAWIEINGRPLGETRDSADQYIPFINPFSSHTRTC